MSTAPRPTERAENWPRWQLDFSFENRGQVASLYFVNTLEEHLPLKEHLSFKTKPKRRENAVALKMILLMALSVDCLLYLGTTPEAS